MGPEFLISCILYKPGGWREKKVMHFLNIWKISSSILCDSYIWKWHKTQDFLVVSSLRIKNLIGISHCSRSKWDRFSYTCLNILIGNWIFHEAYFKGGYWRESGHHNFIRQPRSGGGKWLKSYCLQSPCFFKQLYHDVIHILWNSPILSTHFCDVYKIDWGTQPSPQWQDVREMRFEIQLPAVQQVIPTPAQNSSFLMWMRRKLDPTPAPLCSSISWVHGK